jgi:hypothetical protein
MAPTPSVDVTFTFTAPGSTPTTPAMQRAIALHEGKPVQV